MNDRRSNEQAKHYIEIGITRYSIISGHLEDFNQNREMLVSGLARAVMAPPVGIPQRVPMATRPLRLGQSLVEAGRLKERHLRAALDEQ